MKTDCKIYLLILQFSLPQTFGAEFTDEYLKNLIGNQQHVNVHVSSMVSKRPMIVRMMMGYRSNNAIFTVGTFPQTPHSAGALSTGYVL